MIDGTKIGCGKPGEVTQELMGLFKKAILDGTPF